MHDGRLYFVDHYTRMTRWNDPWQNSVSASAATDTVSGLLGLWA